MFCRGVATVGEQGAICRCRGFQNPGDPGGPNLATTLIHGEVKAEVAKHLTLLSILGIYLLFSLHPVFSSTKTISSAPSKAGVGF